MLWKVHIVQKMVINVYRSKLSSYTITKKVPKPNLFTPKNGVSFNENKRHPELHLLDGKFIYHNQKMAYPIIHSILDFTSAYGGHF